MLTIQAPVGHYSSNRERQKWRTRAWSTIHISNRMTITIRFTPQLSTEFDPPQSSSERVKRWRVYSQLGKLFQRPFFEVQGAQFRQMFSYQELSDEDYITTSQANELEFEQTISIEAPSRFSLLSPTDNEIQQRAKETTTVKNRSWKMERTGRVGTLGKKAPCDNARHCETRSSTASFLMFRSCCSEDSWSLVLKNPCIRSTFSMPT